MQFTPQSGSKFSAIQQRCPIAIHIRAIQRNQNASSCHSTSAGETIHDLGNSNFARSEESFRNRNHEISCPSPNHHMTETTLKTPPALGKGACAEAYLKALAKSPLKALIIGMDPYPRAANGIAFSKDELLSETSSGYKLFKWLDPGCKAADASIEAMGEFHKQGFGFVNLSRAELINKLGRRKKRSLEADAEQNCRLANNAEVVIFVGRTICNTRYLRVAYESVILKGNCYSIPHPAARRGEWNKFVAGWGRFFGKSRDFPKCLAEATLRGDVWIQKVRSV